MRLRLTALALAGACVTLCAQAPARADVIYDFTTTTATNTTHPGAPSADLTLVFDLLDSTVQSGIFSLITTPDLIANPSEPLSYVTGINDFRSLSYTVAGAGTTNTPTSLKNVINIQMAFAPNGDVIASNVTFEGFTEVAYVAGTGATASGIVGTDNDVYSCAGVVYPFPNGEGTSNCTVSGTWSHSTYPSASPVPEPAALAVLGAGLLGLVGLRRRSTVSRD